MPKLRREKNLEDLEYYMKKIRSIEEKIKRRHRRRSENEYSPNSTHLSVHDTDHSISDVEIITSPPRDQSQEGAELGNLMLADNVTTEKDMLTEALPPETPPVESLPTEAPQVMTPPTVTELANKTMVTTEAGAAPSTSTEVLLALGDLMPDKPRFGPCINSDLARIWSTIIKGGLPKEKKLTFLEHLIPENCSLLKAPKLNPEITSSVPENIINRDKKIELEQNQLGTGLAIISTALSTLINNNEVDRLKLISSLNDAGRVLTDLHFMQTRSRKNLLYPVLDKKFLDIVKDVDRDEFLYGSNLSEKIKVLKNCQRTGQSIKKPIPAKSNQGNLNGPPRYSQQRTPARYGQKKNQSSVRPRKMPNQQYHHMVKKPKPQEKTTARA